MYLVSLNFNVLNEIIYSVKLDVSPVGITGRRFLPTFMIFEANRPFLFAMRVSNDLMILQGHLYDPN